VNPLTFIQAILFQWLNPKAWATTLGVISVYTTNSNFLIQLLYIAFIFFIVIIPSLGCWLFFGTQLKKYLKTFKHQKRFNQSMALLLIISILPMIHSFFK
jgi:threonine/homoserine/homoserine lactone efflux protein